jgi:hypothetical protein
MSEPRRRRTLRGLVEQAGLTLDVESVRFDAPNEAKTYPIPHSVDLVTADWVRVLRENGQAIPADVLVQLGFDTPDELPPRTFLSALRPTHDGDEAVTVQDGGPWIMWPAWQRANPPSSRRAAGCLREFLRLETASNESIVRFIRDRGPLGICQHGEPASHTLLCTPRPLEKAPDPFEISPNHRVAFEPLGAYRRFARIARAIVDARVALTNGDCPSDDVWSTICDNTPEYAHHGTRGSSGLRRRTLAASTLGFLVSSWLSTANVGVRVEFRVYPHAWQATASVGNVAGFLNCGAMFGTLAVQLAAFLTSEKGGYRCDSCGDPFTPTVNGRRPKRGQRRYCPHCRQDGYLHSKKSSREAMNTRVAKASRPSS